MANQKSEYIPLTSGVTDDDNEEAAASHKELLEDTDSSLTLRQEARYHKAVLFLAWASVAVLSILSITSFVISQQTGSVALFGFGLDALLDVATSLVVVWRFSGSKEMLHSSHRERIALLLLSGLFIAAALLVGVKSIIFLIQRSILEAELSLYIVSLVAVVCSLLLVVGKMYVGLKLQNKTVISDGYSSLACGVGATAVIVSAYVETINVNIYYLDDIVGLAIGALLMGYGISLLVSNFRRPADL